MTRELESRTAVAKKRAKDAERELPASLEEIDARLRLDRDLIEWQKGSLVRLRRDLETGLRRAEELNAELRRSIESLNERLIALGQHLESVEDSVQRAADLARELSQEANKALRDSARGLDERLNVLGRRLNTLQESARQDPDLAQPLWSSKPWKAYLWLGRRKRAVSQKLAPLTRRLRSVGSSAPQRADAVTAPTPIRPRRSRSARRHRALFIDHHLPTADRDAGSLRIFNLVSVFQGSGFDISFLPHDLDAVEPYATDLRTRGVEVLVAPDISSVPAHLEDRGSLYDLVIVSRAPVAADCIREVRTFCPRAKVVFDTVDLHYLREARLAELEDSDTLREAAERRKQQELSSARQADVTLVVSQAEKDLLARDAPELGVHILPTIHDSRRSRAGFAARQDLLFVAAFGHPHNVDGAVWLVDEILPLIQSRLPGVCLHLVGSEPTAQVRSLASERVSVTGFVPHVEAYFSQCRVSVAPLRYGAGVMGKITQTMASGLPCVTTTIGAEGIGLVHGEDAMIADGEEDFAECVAKVHDDEDLWLRLSHGGMDRVREDFSFAAARRSVAAMLEAIGHPWALERKLHTAEFGSPD